MHADPAGANFSLQTTVFKQKYRSVAREGLARSANSVVSLLLPSQTAASRLVSCERKMCRELKQALPGEDSSANIPQRARQLCYYT